jgi:hypothetical protein
MGRKYTFVGMAAAHTKRRDDYVYVPDQVADNQKDYDGKTFPILRRDKSKARAKLLGDEYGLWTGGTGDMVVAIV